MSIHLRPMSQQDWSEVADLIFASTNYWYQAHGRPPIFAGPAGCTRLFCEVYESLDPECCVVAQSTDTGRLAGSCFYHPRATHVSLGIMNVHPAYFGQGVARRLLNFIVDFAAQRAQPLRLVSSALNLDSYSLYSRAGFVPRQWFQDMTLSVPLTGLTATHPDQHQVRPATFNDLDAIVALDRQLQGLDREKDFRYFLDNAHGIWHLSVYESDQGVLEGFLASVAHPASNMLGPGVSRTPSQAAALILAELDRHRGRCPVWLVPADCTPLVQQMYQWGAKNCELHVGQCLGDWVPPSGVALPTFMPETG